MTAAGLATSGMVMAAVGYLLAFMCHSVEWAAARGLAPVRPADGSEDPSRVRVDMFGRIGVALTVVTALVHVASVVARGIAAERAPWGNMYEFVTSTLALVVVGYLILLGRASARWLGLGVTLLASVGLGLAVTVWYVDVTPLLPALHSVWFVIHIIAAAISGAAFNLAAVAAIAYLVRARAEQLNAVRGYVAKLPDAKRLDLISYRLHAFAFPLWTFTIVAGAIWAQYAWGRPWNWDPKETFAFVTWVIYAAYLHARATAGWRGRPAAIIAIIGLVSFWFNFIGVNLLFKGLHSYAGI